MVEDALRIETAAKRLENGAKTLRARAKSLRQGRSCHLSPEHVTDLQWASYDVDSAHRAADAALDDRGDTK